MLARDDDKRTGMDTHSFSTVGTHEQRKYARKLRDMAKEKEISEYIQDATANGQLASIAGLMKWLGPGGRHGNLQGVYEWYTPEEIVEAARSVMGGIDLDPSSCEFANQIVKAERFFTEEQNGLEQEWAGRVFVNPPFAHPTVKFFAEKLMDSFGSGSVDEAIWLSNACVDVGWWHDLASLGMVCFHRGRIKFYGEDETLQPPTLGQSIFYLGEKREEFKTAFSNFGVVMSA